MGKTIRSIIKCQNVIIMKQFTIPCTPKRTKQEIINIKEYINELIKMSGYNTIDMITELHHYDVHCIVISLQ